MTDLDAAIRRELDQFCVSDMCAEKGRAAIEAVLELHPAGYPGSEIEYEDRVEPAYDKNGVAIGSIRVQGDPVPPYWYNTCQEMAPCPTVKAIATGLGIEVEA